MSDTERLNLIEHYQWLVTNLDGYWFVVGVFGIAEGNTLRQAIDGALTAQIDWSLG